MNALPLILLLAAGADGGVKTAKSDKGSEPAVEAAVDKATKGILDKVQKFYDSVKDLKGSFKQDIKDARYGRQTIGYGYVRLKKPGKMRWEFVQPEKKLFVSDGSVLWVHEPEDEQVYKQSLAESALPSTVSFLFGKGRLDKEFTVTAPEDGGGILNPPPGEIVLKLVPRQPNTQYKHILFVVQMESGMVSRTVVFDHEARINSMTFTGFEINTGQPDSHFAFTPPKGVKVVDPSKLKGGHK